MPAVKTKENMMQSVKNPSKNGALVTPEPRLADDPSVDTSISVGKHPQVNPPREIGGPAGPEPTRYGDWEKNGRCSDF